MQVFFTNTAGSTIRMNKKQESFFRISKEPSVGIAEDERYIRIRSILPGLREEQLRLEIEDETLTISAGNGKGEYKKEITVPALTRFFRKRFHEGILEIILEKPVK